MIARSPHRPAIRDEPPGVKLVALALVAAMLSGGTARVVLADARPGAAAGRMEPVLSLGARPSHGGLYRAGVVSRSGGRRPGAPQSWILQVERADGAPVPDATLRVSARMPDTGEQASGPRPTISRLGGGRYRIDGLRFHRPGWWNVPVRIRAGGDADSLAFNLIIPGATAAEALVQMQAIPGHPVGLSGSDRAERSAAQYLRGLEAGLRGRSASPAPVDRGS